MNSKINDHGPRGHKAGGAAIGGAAQPALSSWPAFSPAAVTDNIQKQEHFNNISDNLPDR